MKCKKHQWDYVGLARIGKETIAAYRELFCIWRCPYCNKEKRTKSREIIM